MWDNLFSSVDLLQKGFDAANLRYQTIANNIANVDTPGFQSSEVDFESLMSDALGLDEESNALTRSGSLQLTATDEDHIATAGQARMEATDGAHADSADGLSMTATDDKHYASAAEDDDVTAQVTTDDVSLRYDENSVDIESEMTELVKNTMFYYSLTAKTNSEFTKLKTVINA